VINWDHNVLQLDSDRLAFHPEPESNALHHKVTDQVSRGAEHITRKRNRERWPKPSARQAGPELAPKPHHLHQLRLSQVARRLAGLDSLPVGPRKTDDCPPHLFMHRHLGRELVQDVAHRKIGGEVLNRETASFGSSRR